MSSADDAYDRFCQALLTIPDLDENEPVRVLLARTPAHHPIHRSLAAAIQCRCCLKVGFISDVRLNEETGELLCPFCDVAGCLTVIDEPHMQQ